MSTEPFDYGEARLTDFPSATPAESTSGSIGSPDPRTLTPIIMGDGASSTSAAPAASSTAERDPASASTAPDSSSSAADPFPRYVPSAEARRPLLLGEAPSKRGDRYHAFPLSGPPAERLREFAWLPIEDGEAAYWTLTRHFETLNAIERWADAYPWSKERARGRWTEWTINEGILEEYRRPPGDPRPPFVVVCVGRKAGDAIGLSEDRPWFEWLFVGTLAAAVIPHTSGRNRVLNDPAMGGRAGRTLLEAIRLAGRPCPFDTDGDGDCGKRRCPACGPDYRAHA